MTTEPNPTPSPWLGRAGLALSALPIFGLGMSASMKFMAPPEFVKMFVDHLGWPAELLPRLGALELGCVLLYLVPQTSVLGAILLTGYLGGALSAHVRTGEFAAPTILLGLMVWGGLYLRDARLRDLLPLRRKG